MESVVKKNKLPLVESRSRGSKSFDISGAVNNVESLRRMCRQRVSSKSESNNKRKNKGSKVLKEREANGSNVSRKQTGKRRLLRSSF